MAPLHHTAPLAYFITFRTYGTWLPGNPRGTVDTHHDLPGTPYAPVAAHRALSGERLLLHPPITLDAEERALILRSVRQVCDHRAWTLYAAHIRTNHVHAVIQAEHGSERVMNDLKVWATRRLVEAGLRERGTRVWVKHGSTRYLWRKEAVGAACAYVVEGQGVGREFAFVAGGEVGSLTLARPLACARG